MQKKQSAVLNRNSQNVFFLHWLSFSFSVLRILCSIMFHLDAPPVSQHVFCAVASIDNCSFRRFPYLWRVQQVVVHFTLMFGCIHCTIRCTVLHPPPSGGGEDIFCKDIERMPRWSEFSAEKKEEKNSDIILVLYSSFPSCLTPTSHALLAFASSPGAADRGLAIHELFSRAQLSIIF